MGPSVESLIEGELKGSLMGPIEEVFDLPERRALVSLMLLMRYYVISACISMIFRSIMHFLNDFFLLFVIDGHDGGDAST